MKRIRLLLPITAIVFLFHGLFFSNAYAYIDPGSGSAILAMIISAIAGIGITLKIYWEKLKYRIFSRNKKNE